MRLAWCLGLLLAIAWGAATAAEAPRAGRYENVVAPPRPEVAPGEWARHLIRMQLGLFPRAAELPDDHVLSEAAARAGLPDAATARVAVTWVGHSTALVRMGGKWIMTDPVLMPSIGVGPLSIARLSPPRPVLADLPRIDVILISHGDYDHLDLRTLRRLVVRNPDVLILVPEGNARLLAPLHARNVIEMGWYESRTWQGLGFEAVPAIHGLRRPPEPRDSAHWAGWIIRAGSRSVYFAGDTGFGPVFSDTRRRSGPVDFALVPIGAYEPRRLEAPFHVSPEEAAEIGRILGARVAIGIHWGTFPLGEEAPTEQRRRFLAASGRGMETLAPRVGETIVLVK
jgi:L-ascorbate metabolism protein UlaG (beta-lactamase superfamily)